MFALFKIGGWLAKLQPSDPNVMESFNDISDLLDVIKQGWGL